MYGCVQQIASIAIGYNNPALLKLASIVRNLSCLFQARPRVSDDRPTDVRAHASFNFRSLSFLAFSASFRSPRPTVLLSARFLQSNGLSGSRLV